MKEKVILNIDLYKYSQKSTYVTRTNKFFDIITEHLMKYDVGAINVSSVPSFPLHHFKYSNIKVIHIRSNKKGTRRNIVDSTARERIIYYDQTSMVLLSGMLYIYLFDNYRDEMSKTRYFELLLGENRHLVDFIIKNGLIPPYNNLFHSYLYAETFITEQLKKKTKRLDSYVNIRNKHEAYVYLIYIWIIYNILYTYYNRCEKYGYGTFISQLNNTLKSKNIEDYNSLYENNIDIIKDMVERLMRDIDKYKWFIFKYYRDGTYQLIEEINDLIKSYKEMYKDDVIVTNESLLFMLSVFGAKYNILDNYYFLITDKVEEEKFYIYDNNDVPHNGLYISFNIPDCNTPSSLCRQLNVRTKPRKLIIYD